MKVPRPEDRASSAQPQADALTDLRAEATALRVRHELRAGIAGLCDLMDRLLAPDGCPWDREQTLETLRPYLIEEAHEVAAVMTGPPGPHREELGDLLFQIVFQTALRRRAGSFDLDTVVDGILTKMVRRHPHVFAPADGQAPQSAEDVERAWARIKAEERAGAGADGPQDPLAGVPSTLPALVRAYRLQEKAAAVGFDWPDVAGVWRKLDEEWQELREAARAGDPEAVREELGDVLFVLVRLAHKLGVDPDAALHGAISKFERRFAHVMARCHEEGLAPQEAGLARMDAFWDEAKARERG